MKRLESASCPEAKGLVRPASSDLSRFLQWRINALAAGRLPCFGSRLYLGLLGRFYFLLAPGQKKAIQAALDCCLAERFSTREIKAVWPQVRRGIFDHYHEKLLLGFRPFDWVRQTHLAKIEISGLESLNQALELGRGVILVTGHFGAVEFIPGALAFRGFPVTIMVHCKTKGLRQKLEEKSSLAGARLLDPKSAKVFFLALDHLRQGRILITQCDEMEMWRPYPDQQISFLGLNLGLDRSLDVLARKSKAPVLFGLNHRLGKGRYRLVLERPEDHPAARGQALVSAQCLSILSDYIYATPGAWYEWKKLKPFLEKAASKIAHEDRLRLGLPGQMALCPAGPA